MTIYIARLAVLVLVLLTVAISVTRVGKTQVGQPQTVPVDLSGDWELDTGQIIKIEHLPATGTVIATFSPSVECHNDRRTILLTSTLKVTPGTGGAPTVALADGPFYACTRDKRLIDSCAGITAVWKSKFRNAMVSPGGNVITGERFYEWLAYDGEENGRFINCRRDPSKDGWSSFRLTRVCSPDQAKRCRAISQIIGAIGQIIPGGLHSPTVAEWNQTVASKNAALAAALTKLRALYCDDAQAQAEIDDMEAKLHVIASTPATTPAEVVAQQMGVAGIDLDLKVMATAACGSSGPATPPPASGICPRGSPPKRPGDNEAIDAARKQIEDAIKEVQKMLEEYEREAGGGASTDAGKYADYYRTRLNQLKKLKGYWDMIRSASCIPPELVDLIRSVMGGRTDMCTDLCYETAKWIETWYPGPNGDIQKKMFLELCGFNCP